jgi:dUTP pyrophosphatase
VNKSIHKIPEHTTERSAGMDLRANINSDIILKSLDLALISSGLYIELPDRFVAQIMPEGGLPNRNGISVLNESDRITDWFGNKGKA